MRDQRLENLDRILAKIQHAERSPGMPSRWQFARFILQLLDDPDNIGYLSRLMVLVSLIREDREFYLTAAEGQLRKAWGL